MSKRKVIGISVAAIAALFMYFFIWVLPRGYVIPILMYHSVENGAPPENRLVVSPQTFDRQMRFLKEHRYNVISLERLAGLLKAKAVIPPWTVVITLDDGYRNNYTEAFPILKRYGLPATIFVIVKEVGRPQHDRLSWEEIKEMQSSGLITVGSHCLGPEPLINIPSPQQLHAEVFNSKMILQQQLGRDVVLFSYPEGMFTPHIRQLVIDAGYLAAVGTTPGKTYPSDDRYVLKRLRISETSRNLFVFAIQISGFYTFIKEHRK